MKTSLTALLCVLSFLALSGVEAARAPEDRSKATHVVTGVVHAVFERSNGIYKQYVVRLKVEAVEKGTGVEAGEFFYAYCFKRGPVKEPVEPGALGHNAIPKEGQRIKAYIHHRRGQFEGIYPDWFDVVESD